MIYPDFNNATFSYEYLFLKGILKVFNSHFIFILIDYALDKQKVL